MNDTQVTYPFGPDTQVIARASREDDHASSYLDSQWPGLFFKAGFQPREQFSASQIETSHGCEMSWGFRYLWGLKPREYTWEEVLSGAGTKRDRSTAFGKAMHSQGESYYTTGHYQSDTAPGRALTAGLHLLPHPTQCEVIEVELGIDLDTRYIQGGSDPVRFVGFKDLVTRVAGDWFLFDYKSTKDFDYQKQLDDRRSKRGYIIHGLRDDLASNVYALDVMQKIGQESLRGRWVYFKSEGRPEARATDIVWERQHSKAIVNQGLIQAVHLRQHIRAGTSPHELDANPEHCGAFGGCPYRASVGGPCTKEHSGQFLLGTAIEQAEPKLLPAPSGAFFKESEAQHMPQLPGESLVQMKIREARAAAAGGAPAPQAQAPAPQPQGFAPQPPGGFMQPPVQAALPPALQPQTFAPPPAAPAFAPPPVAQPAPPAFAPPPVQSHVLPPEASQAPPAPELPPQLPAPHIQAPGAPVAGPLGEPPAKRRGRGKTKVGTDPGGSAGTQGFTVSTSFEFGDATITIEAGSVDDALGLVSILQAALS